MDTVLDTLRARLQSSILLRVLFIGFVMLLLQIPIGMISSQIHERQLTRDQAYEDITGKWGRQQSIAGPRLVVPYYEINSWKNPDGVVERVKQIRYAVFLPEALNAEIVVENDSRYRGLFEVPVYQASIALDGTFARPDFAHWGIDAALIVWDKAQLAVGIADAGSIRRQVQLEWNGQFHAFGPGLGKVDPDASGLHVARLDLGQGETFDFSISLALNGSAGLYLAPMAEQTELSIQSDWPDPSFNGYRLPNRREIDRSGFSASWSISHISRNYPQQWLDREVSDDRIEASVVGVDFVAPVDNYRMVERSIKYVVLFLLLTFVAVWLIEVTVGVRVHLMQYLLLGLAMCVFYLLLLALSEHIGFVWAYAIASVAVVLKTALYSKAVLKTTKRAALIGGGIAAMYLYLFSLLQEQSYSMLSGAIGVFLVLAAIMYVTRDIDWFTLGKP